MAGITAAAGCRITPDRHLPYAPGKSARMTEPNPTTKTLLDIPPWPVLHTHQLRQEAPLSKPQAFSIA
jgi:hypothetical protein